MHKGLCANVGADLTKKICMLSDVQLKGGDLHLTANKVHLKNSDRGENRIMFDVATGNIELGGGHHDGDLVLNNADGRPVIHLDGGGGGGNNPDVSVYIDGKHGNLWLGKEGQDGDIFLRGPDGKVAIQIDTGGNTHDASTSIYLDGKNGNVILGAEGKDGDLWLRNNAGKSTIHLDGELGNLTLGGEGQDGDIILRDEVGAARLHLDATQGRVDVDTRIYLGAKNGEMRLGGLGQAGEWQVRDETGKPKIKASCNMDGGRIDLRGAKGDNVVVLDGAAGTITVGALHTPGKLTVLSNNNQTLLRAAGSKVTVQGNLVISDGSSNVNVLQQLEDLQRQIGELKRQLNP